MTYLFNPYTSTPSKKDKNFISIDYGGYAGCIPRDNTGYTLPNCVAFCHGMWLSTITEAVSYEEARRIEYAMCWGNAEDYWNYNDGFKRGQTPKLNAIMVWEGKGSLKGHVMTVTTIKSNGDVIATGSDYSGAKFYTKTYYKSEGYNFSSSYIFKGFIYCPYEFVYNIGTPVTRDTSKDQLEVIATTLRVRHDASTNKWPEGYINPGIYDIIDSKENGGYHWYKIGKDMWIANDKEQTWCKVLPMERVGKPVERNDNVDQIEVIATTLNARKNPGLKGEVLGFAALGYYNCLDTAEADGYKWYKTEDFWCAQSKNGDWVTFYPKREPKYDLNIIGLNEGQNKAMIAWCEAEGVKYTVTEY